MTELEILSLLADVKSGKRDAFETLAGAYAPLIESSVSATASKIASLKGSSVKDVSEDLRQEARLALYNAAQKYDPDGVGKYVTIGLYAKICIRNAMISEIRRESAARRRHARAEADLSAVAAAKDDANRAGLLERLEQKRSSLSPFESKVLDGYLDGKPAREIGRELGCSAKAVSNAIYRIKSKLR